MEDAAKSTAKKAVSKGPVHSTAKELSAAPFMAVELRSSEKFLISPSNFHFPLLYLYQSFSAWFMDHKNGKSTISFFFCSGICNWNVKIARKGESMAMEAPEGTRRERDKRTTSLDDRAHHEGSRTSIYAWFHNNTQTGKTKDTLKERIDHIHWRAWRETQKTKKFVSRAA